MVRIVELILEASAGHEQHWNIGGYTRELASQVPTSHARKGDIRD